MTADQFRARLHAEGSGCVRFEGPIRVWFNGATRETVRVLYELSCGKPPPKGRQLCRTCDNPNCIAPSHRKLGGEKKGTSKRGRKKKAKSC